ncbi:hypothetical protein [Blastomonas sp.]|uniref:hypothetical protein n=1 Tax=Blastomonas sp. TaxID=1909299 RepID=UPI00359371F3
MQFLKILVAIMLAVAFVVFSYNNWQVTAVELWGGLELVTKLPVLLVITFLAGFLPLWLVHRTSSWRLKRRIATLEANQTRSYQTLATTAMATPGPAAPMHAPAAQPTADNTTETPFETPSEPASVLRSI